MLNGEQSASLLRKRYKRCRSVATLQRKNEPQNMRLGSFFNKEFLFCVATFFSL